MAAILFLTIPGLVLLLTILAITDQLLLRLGRAGLLPWRPGTRQGQIASTGFEQLHAAFSPGKHEELKTRASTLVLRDDDEDGAPPSMTAIDLQAGTAVISRDKTLAAWQLQKTSSGSTSTATTRPTPKKPGSG